VTPITLPGVYVPPLRESTYYANRMAGAVSDVASRIPALRQRVVCPVEGCEGHLDLTFGVRYVGTVSIMIPHLNDDHKWTREQIADWADSLPFSTEVFQDPVVTTEPSPKDIGQALKDAEAAVDHIIKEESKP